MSTGRTRLRVSNVKLEECGRPCRATKVVWLHKRDMTLSSTKLWDPPRLAVQYHQGGELGSGQRAPHPECSEEPLRPLGRGQQLSLRPHHLRVLAPVPLEEGVRPSLDVQQVPVKQQVHTQRGWRN
eukprot:2780886-Pyramimonas_sp.AAC.1